MSQRHLKARDDGKDTITMPFSFAKQMDSFVMWNYDCQAGAELGLSYKHMCILLYVLEFEGIVLLSSSQHDGLIQDFQMELWYETHL